MEGAVVAQAPSGPLVWTLALGTLGFKAELREPLLSFPAYSPRPKQRKQLLKVSVQRQFETLSRFLT